MQLQKSDDKEKDISLRGRVGQEALLQLIQTFAQTCE